MNAETQNARARKRDAAINKCLKDQENEFILQKYRSMPWMLPKELEMFGSHKEYNKRSAHHAIDQQLDKKLTDDGRRGAAIRKEAMQLVARQIADNIEERRKLR